MKLAVLADIHGNLAALEAVLDHVAGQAVDELVIAGDIVVVAADSAACWQLAASLGGQVLRGNHETYVASFDGLDAPQAWKTEPYAPVHWAAARLGNTERKKLGGFL